MHTHAYEVFAVVNGGCWAGILIAIARLVSKACLDTLGTNLYHTIYKVNLYALRLVSDIEHSILATERACRRTALQIEMILTLRDSKLNIVVCRGAIRIEVEIEVGVIGIDILLARDYIYTIFDGCKDYRVVVVSLGCAILIAKVVARKIGQLGCRRLRFRLGSRLIYRNFVLDAIVL